MARENIVKIVMDDEEFRTVKMLAGHEALSSYCRRMALGGGEPRKERGMEQKCSGARDVAPYPGSAEMPTPPKPKLPAQQVTTLDAVGPVSGEGGRGKVSLPTPAVKRPKHPNNYCKAHHVMGCLVCE